MNNASIAALTSNAVLVGTDAVARTLLAVEEASVAARISNYNQDDISHQRSVNGEARRALVTRLQAAITGIANTGNEMMERPIEDAELAIDMLGRMVAFLDWGL